jgi:hypothetical protein
MLDALPFYTRLAIGVSCAAAGPILVTFGGLILNDLWKSSQTPTTTSAVERRPTFESTNHSTISARGAVIPADLAFPFARADGHSLIDISGLTATKADDGSLHVTLNKVNANFPSPDGEFAMMSSAVLKARLKETSSELRELQARYSARMQSAFQAQDEGAAFKELLLNYQPELDRYASLSFALACAAMNKIGIISDLPVNMQGGLTVVYNKKFAGPRPADDAALFLEFLAAHIDS